MAITSSQTSRVAHGRSPHGCYVRTRIFRTVKGQTCSHPMGSVDSSKLFHAKSLWGNGLSSPHCDSDLPDRPENEAASRRTWQSERDRSPDQSTASGRAGKRWNRIDLRGSSIITKLPPPPAIVSQSGVAGRGKASMNAQASSYQRCKSKRSNSITLCHAAAKSFTSLAWPPSLAYTSEIARNWECDPKSRSTELAVHRSFPDSRSFPS